jgi:hypothetical protein
MCVRTANRRANSTATLVAAAKNGRTRQGGAHKQSNDGTPLWVDTQRCGQPPTPRDTAVPRTPHLRGVCDVQQGMMRPSTNHHPPAPALAQGREACVCLVCLARATPGMLPHHRLATNSKTTTASAPRGASCGACTTPRGLSCALTQTQTNKHTHTHTHTSKCCAVRSCCRTNSSCCHLVHGIRCAPCCARASGARRHSNANAPGLLGAGGQHARSPGGSCAGLLQLPPAEVPPAVPPTTRRNRARRHLPPARGAKHHSCGAATAAAADHHVAEVHT